MADANADLIAQASAATAQAVAGALGNLRLRPTPTVKLNRLLKWLPSQGIWVPIPPWRLSELFC